VLSLLRASARESGCAIIMVTHDPRAAAVTDRVLEFKDGRLVSEQRPRPVAVSGNIALGDD
jgi:ABC-type lipoprotein export system ATPase subunit